jgi:hypothetical protein
MIAKCLSTSHRYASLHPRAGKLAEFCQALYPLLVAHADDFGRMSGDNFTIKFLVVPASPRSVEEIGLALDALHDVGLVERYTDEGRMCLQVTLFDRHQSGLHKRTASDFPESPGISRNFRVEEKGTELKGTEGKGTEQNPAPARFAAFWMAYPRKTQRKDAERAFTRLNPSPALFETLVAALAVQKQSEQWATPHLIPHAATWLRGERWDDQLPFAVAKTGKPDPWATFSMEDDHDPK